MTEFVLGALAMWTFLSIVIWIGNDCFNQKCDDWSDWYIFFVCFPAVIFYIPFNIIVETIKKIKRNKS